jgi:hypothetical protein
VGVLFDALSKAIKVKPCCSRSPAAEVGCSAMYMTLLWKYSAS